MIWGSNLFSGSGLYFRVRAGFGPELIGPFTTLKSFAYHHMMTFLEEFFNIPIPLSAGVESIFSLGSREYFFIFSLRRSSPKEVKRSRLQNLGVF